MSSSTKKGSSRPFPIMCGAGQNAVVNPSGKDQKKHSGQKSKKPRKFISDVKVLFEAKRAEPKLPKYLKAASASNSPAALSYDSWGGQSIMLPKLVPPPDVERRYTASSSSRPGDRNNGTQEPEGYQARAPPAGSYPDDDTGPSPKNLVMAVMGVKSAVNHFAKVLITNINKHPEELEFLKQRILQEVRADTDRANHWKFLVQAFLCQRLFDGFGTPNGYFGIEHFQGDRMTRLNSFADFTKYKDKASTISMLLDSNLPDKSFLGRFCFKKFKSIVGESASNQPLPIYRDEWDAVTEGYHRKTVFYESFLKVAVSVWLVHRLVHSFDEKVDMLIYERGAKFQRQTMESVVPGSYEEEDEEADVNTEVGFSVIPGFQVSRSVVKCDVYLQSNNRHTDMELTVRTSTDKTPVKTSSNRPQGKSLSAKTSVNLHTPEQPARRHRSSPGSLEPSEGFRSSSHYVDHYDSTRARDAVSGDLATRDAGVYWDARRESLSPGIQESFSRSGRKIRYEHELLSDTYPVSHGHGTTVHRLGASTTRTANHVRGVNYVARDTQTSAMRRLSNTRHNPKV